MSAVRLRNAPDGLLASPAAAAGMAALVAGASSWAVLSAGWIGVGGSALAIGVAGVLEAGLLAWARLGRLWMLIAAPFAGLASVVLATLAAMPRGSGPLGWRGLLSAYGGALSRGLLTSGAGGWAFNVGLCGVLWLSGFSLGWLAIRERAGVPSLLPACAVLSVNALNAPDPGRVLIPTLVGLAAALLLLAQTHLRSLDERWARRGTVILPGLAPRFARAASAAVGLVILIGSGLPPATNRDVSYLLFGSGEPGTGAADGSRGNRNPSAKVAFSPLTEPGGALINDPRPVFTYTVSPALPVYLRVVADTVFDAGNWYPARLGVGVQAIAAPAGARLPRQRSRAVGGVGDHRVTVAARVVPLAGGGGNLGIFPGEPETISLDATAVGVLEPGSRALLTVDYTMLPGGQNPGVDREFSSSGTISTAAEADLRQAGTHYPAFVRDYVTLNGASSGGGLEALRALALKWAAGTGNAYDSAKAVELHLRDPREFTYTLSPPPVPPRVWPIVYFATTGHRGYCQYFASTMGTMLRLLGIPTRLVNGYGAGRVTDELGPRAGSPRSRTVTTGDAHTWVESYFPGYGWIPFEPTPPSVLGDYQPVPRGGQSPAGGPPPPSPSATPAPSPSSSPSPMASTPVAPPVRASALDVPSALAATSLISIVLLAVLAAGLLWLSRPSNPAGVWRRIELGARLIGARRITAETHLAFARRLSVALPPDTTTLGHRDGRAPVGPRPVYARTGEALQELALLTGKSLFAVAPLAPGDEVRWRRCWSAILRAAPVLLWRSLLRATSARAGGHSGEVR